MAQEHPPHVGVIAEPHAGAPLISREGGLEGIGKHYCGIRSHAPQGGVEPTAVPALERIGHKRVGDALSLEKGGPPADGYHGSPGPRRSKALQGGQRHHGVAEPVRQPHGERAHHDLRAAALEGLDDMPADEAGSSRHDDGHLSERGGANRLPSTSRLPAHCSRRRAERDLRERSLRARPGSRRLHPAGCSIPNRVSLPARTRRPA